MANKCILIWRRIPFNYKMCPVSLKRVWGQFVHITIFAWDYRLLNAVQTYVDRNRNWNISKHYIITSSQKPSRLHTSWTIKYVRIIWNSNQGTHICNEISVCDHHHASRNRKLAYQLYLNEKIRIMNGRMWNCKLDEFVLLLWI